MRVSVKRGSDMKLLPIAVLTGLRYTSVTSMASSRLLRHVGDIVLQD